MSSSSSQSAIPLIACLLASEKFLGKGLTWYAANDIQERFLEDFFKKGLSIDWSKLSPEELARICTRKAKELEEFFKARGFEFQIDEFGPGEFGVGAVQKMPVRWSEEGQEFFFDINGTAYPVARLDGGVSIISVARHEYPIARILSDSDIVAYMTRLDECPEGLDLLREAHALSTRSYKNERDYAGVIFPKVDLDVDVSLDWIVNLSTLSESGTPFRITKAAQKNRLKMNHKGALGESAAYMVMESFSIPVNVPLLIDGPFMVWFEKKGIPFPYFAAYCAEDCWKDPGEFEV